MTEGYHVKAYGQPVKRYVQAHPLVPKDFVVRGFIIGSETGALEEVI